VCKQTPIASGPSSLKFLHHAAMRLSNKRALITGGAQGIGYAIAEAFCREGAVVYIADVNDDLGSSAAKKLRDKGAKATFIHLDVTSENDWRRVFSQIEQDVGGLDILVNNAGINIRKVIEEMSPEELDRMYGVNIKGPFLGIKQAIPAMKKVGGGSIINMSSMCGLIGHLYTPEAYTTTKGAVQLLTKSVASRYGKFNIRCNSINPSTADTALTQQILTDPEKRKERLGEVPLGRLASMQDIAEAAVYLASQDGAFINGLALSVDGGVTAY
jgi:NAD(P)-dependent dehydrogenase (short-subunit alcohol dehydrogenase family)